MIQDWLSRTALLVGEHTLESLSNMHIMVVGLGGVGGICAEMIARAGVGSMTIVDGDIVERSNINRQAVATHSVIGEPKAEVMARKLKDINPEINVFVKNYYIKGELVEQLFENAHYDYVLDCIDTLSPKVFLIENCVRRQIPIASSMGAGSKIDVSQVRVVDLSKTYNCPLARYVRKRLGRLGIRKGIKVVYSPEREHVGTIEVMEEKGPKRSVVGTISYMPTLFGVMLAGEVLKDLVMRLESHQKPVVK